ncbi:MAG: transporter associated domain-containing protein, partial [Vicinamibacteria bacterium]
LRSESDEPRKGVAAAMRPATFVPENSDALDLLKEFQESGQHMAVVLDEHGGVSGVVTLHDLLEAMVGDLPHADEPSEPPAVQREDGSWLIDGSLGIEDFKDLFRVRSLNEEKEGSFHTVSGLVMAALRRVPRSGDSFDTSGLSVEVLDMDGNRVDKVLVTPSNREA